MPVLKLASCSGYCSSRLKLSKYKYLAAFEPLVKVIASSETLHPPASHGLIPTSSTLLFHFTFHPLSHPVKNSRKGVFFPSELPYCERGLSRRARRHIIAGLFGDSLWSLQDHTPSLFSNQKHTFALDEAAN